MASAGFLGWEYISQSFEIISMSQFNLVFTEQKCEQYTYKLQIKHKRDQDMTTFLTITAENDNFPAEYSVQSVKFSRKRKDFISW
jgi:hypothetical protein